MSTDQNTRVLADSGAARYIGMSESWLRQSRMTGNPDAPPYLKIGRSVRYLRDDLDAWLDQCRRGKTNSRDTETR